MPIAWAPAFHSAQWLRPNPYGRSASSTPKRHASSFVNCTAASREEGFRIRSVRALPRIYSAKARRKFRTLFNAEGIIVENRPRPAFTFDDISRKDKRARRQIMPTDATLNKARIY